MHAITWKLAASAGLAFFLAACGGGGGSGLNSAPAPAPVPTPSPAPTPTPTPTPTPSAAPFNIFPNLEESTWLATMGYEASKPGPGQTISSAGFSVRYDAKDGNYYMDLPSSEMLPFNVFSYSLASSTWWHGSIKSPSTAGSNSVEAFVLKPTNPELQLSYTTLASYFHLSDPYAFGAFAFGQATPAGNVPVQGSATYDALIQGRTSDYLWFVDGDAQLNFNFGTGTLTGHMNAILNNGWDYYPTVRYDFSNTVFSAGSTSFSGSLVAPGVSPGSFDGIFTGPNAQELMAKWQAPHASTGTTIFGVWVGKKQ